LNLAVDALVGRFDRLHGSTAAAGKSQQHQWKKHV
jgi:hypothetical protein